MLGTQPKHVCGYGFGGDNRITKPDMQHPPSVVPPPGVTAPSLPAGLELVTRQEWGAYFPYDYEPLELPVTHVRLTHTGGKSCRDRKSCYFRVKKTQWDSMYHCGLQDVAFNFLIDPEGRVYQGRGWLAQPEREDINLTGRLQVEYEIDKSKCIDIAFVGRFNRAPPSAASLESARRLVTAGVEGGLVAADYRVLTCRKATHNVPLDHVGWITETTDERRRRLRRKRRKRQAKLNRDTEKFWNYPDPEKEFEWTTLEESEVEKIQKYSTAPP